jgi:hypothetical protein
VQPGDRLDLVVTLDSRTFGGFESLQLVVRDAASHGVLAGLAADPEADVAASEYGAGAVG